MSPDQDAKIWVPTCCNQVMRFNLFGQRDGGAYGAFVCTVCSKNITLEQESLAKVNNYGAGTSVLSVVASPRPPKEERRSNRSADDDATTDEPTL
jgi:hypothetical protein